MRWCCGSAAGDEESGGSDRSDATTGSLAREGKERVPGRGAGAAGRRPRASPAKSPGLGKKSKLAATAAARSGRRRAAGRERTDDHPTSGAIERGSAGANASLAARSPARSSTRRWRRWLASRRSTIGARVRTTKRRGGDIPVPAAVSHDRSTTGASRDRPRGDAGIAASSSAAGSAAEPLAMERRRATPRETRRASARIYFRARGAQLSGAGDRGLDEATSRRARRASGRRASRGGQLARAAAARRTRWIV